MVDFSARAGYRGTAELPHNSLPSRRSANKTDENSDVSEIASRAKWRPVGRRPENGGAAGPRQINGGASVERADGWSIFSKKESGAKAAAPKPASDATSVKEAVAPKIQEQPLATPLTRAEADALVVKALKDALSAAGVNFDALGLAAHEDVVTYPGGSYINRYISVTTKSGHMEGLMTDLVAINPKVAVLDIQRMMGTIA
jgi:hypothetical protein